MTSSEKASLVPAEVKAHRYVELDSLRGLAALSVLLYHFSCIWFGSAGFRALQMSPAHIFVAGHEAVVFFFVLSGFVLCVPYSGKRPPGYLAYLAQRLVRIYLPYAAAIVIALVLDLYFYSTVRTGNFWLDQTWTYRPTFSMLTSLLLTMSSYGTQANTAIWSVILEVRISLIFPLLYFVVRRSKAMLVSAFFMLMPIVAAWRGLSSPHFYSPFFTAGLFCFGIVLYLRLEDIMSFYKRQERKGRLSFLALSVALFEIPLTVVGRFVSEPGYVLSGLVDYLVAVGAAGIIVASISSASIRRLLQNGFLIRNGALSYSIYLIHGSILFCIIRYFSGKVNMLYMLPVFLISTYLFAELFHFLIDSRAVMLGRSVGKYARERWPSFGAQAAALDRGSTTRQRDGESSKAV